MKPLDIFNPDILSEENAKVFLSDKQYKLFLDMSKSEREYNLEELLTKPIEKFTVINELYFRSKWADLFKLFYKDTPYATKQLSLLFSKEEKAN